jgi:hypothetical protein
MLIPKAYYWDSIRSSFLPWLLVTGAVEYV